MHAWLRDLIEIDMPAVSALAGDETWRGPRADDVREDLQKIRRLLAEIREISSRASVHTLGFGCGPDLLRGHRCF
jgi:hypothetical protein